MPELEAFAAQATDEFSTELKAAILTAKLPGLGDGPINAGLVDLLQAGQIKQHLGNVAGQCDTAISGLWLLAGDIDRSHDISQDLPSAEGSFLHGIMHRREGDFGNAKYWFRRVGSHRVLEQVADAAGDVYDDPYDFIDRCSEAVRSGDAKQDCVAAQWIEWQLLMAHILVS